MISIAKTHIGMKRANNEDYIYSNDNPIGALPNIYVVADGMGGYNGGEIASSEAVKSFVEYISLSKNNEITDILVEGINKANNHILNIKAQNEELCKMGTTIDCACVKDNTIYIAHIGDSRVYLINDEIHRLTTDHSYVMNLVRAGLITLEEAETHPNKNMITRAVGIEENIECDVIISHINPNDYILLCSDGLFGMMNDKKILEIVKNENLSLEEKTNMLIDGANQNGGRDNISVVLVKN